MDINKDDCPICQDRLQNHWNQNLFFGSDTFLLKTPCNHFYHTKCIKEWFNMGNDCCPKCTRVTNEDELFPANMFVKIQMFEKYCQSVETTMQRSLLSEPQLYAANAEDAEEKAEAAHKAAKAAEEAEKAAQEEEEMKEGGER